LLRPKLTVAIARRVRYWADAVNGRPHGRVTSASLAFQAPVTPSWTTILEAQRFSHLAIPRYRSHYSPTTFAVAYWCAGWCTCWALRRWWALPPLSAPTKLPTQSASPSSVRRSRRPFADDQELTVTRCRRRRIVHSIPPRPICQRGLDTGQHHRLRTQLVHRRSHNYRKRMESIRVPRRTRRLHLRRGQPHHDGGDEALQPLSRIARLQRTTRDAGPRHLEWTGVCVDHEARG